MLKKTPEKSQKNEDILKIKLRDEEKSAKMILSNSQIFIPFEIDNNYLKIPKTSLKITIEIGINFVMLDRDIVERLKNFQKIFNSSQKIKNFLV